MDHRSLILGTVLTLLTVAACSKIGPSSPKLMSSIEFEEKPRRVLEFPMISTSRDPKIYVRASGAIYLLAPYGDGKNQNLGLFISRDGGDHFAPPVPINPTDSSVSSHGENSPTLTFGKRTEVYALWEQKKDSGESNLVVSRSLRFGNRFDPPVLVTDKTESSSNAFSSLTVAPNGDLYVVWLDGRNPDDHQTGTSSVYLARSLDQGLTFEKNRQVYPRVCPCCRPNVIVGSQSEIYVSWRHVFDGEIRDVVVATSYDGGKSFSDPVRVSRDNWEIAGCPHSGSSLLNNEDRLYVTWFSDPHDRVPGIQLSWSTDKGETFAEPIAVSRDLVDANHPGLAQAEDGQLLLIFQGRDPKINQGWGPARPYLVQFQFGIGPTKPLPIPGSGASVSYPFVVSGGQGRIYVGWTQGGTQGSEVVLSRGRRQL